MPDCLSGLDRSGQDLKCISLHLEFYKRGKALAKISKGHLSFHQLHFTLFTFCYHCIMVASYLSKIANCGPKSAKFSTKKAP